MPFHQLRPDESKLNQPLFRRLTLVILVIIEWLCCLARLQDAVLPTSARFVDSLFLSMMQIYHSWWSSNELFRLNSGVKYDRRELD